MREIKFRGECMYSDEWVYGDLIHKRHDRDALMIQDENGLGSDVIPESVGQFTGLHDKNGKEIYEGDVARNKEVGGYGFEYVGVVRYYEEDARFGIDVTATSKISKRVLFSVGERCINDGHCTIKYTNEYEVIGNIHDNPTLLNNAND